MRDIQRLWKTGVGICLSIFIMVTAANAQESGDKHPDLRKFDTLTLNQQNGPEINIIGLGKRHLSYSETIDGYTVVRNKNGVYEYAERASKGDLQPSGQVAHDPSDRERDELVFLKKIAKHLRYKQPKLDEILEKQNRFFRIKSNGDD